MVNLNMANVASILQWTGFVDVVVGLFIYSKRPGLGAGLSITGCLFLIAWCFMLEPVPWGILMVQVMCVVAWARNWRLAKTRVRNCNCHPHLYTLCPRWENDCPRNPTKGNQK